MEQTAVRPAAAPIRAVNGGSPGALTPAEEDAWIWRSFEEHSRTFSMAARLLPRPVRMPIAVVYLFCRTVDNLADHRVRIVGPAQALRELGEMKAKLKPVLAGGRSDELLWRRLGEVHARFGLRPEPFYELIDGAAWDLEGRTIRDEQDLLHYANLVGGSIGAMLLPFLTDQRERYPELEPGARALGTAMQITNILRDVGEDLVTLGRLYVPQTLLDEYGLTREALLESRLPAPYPLLVERLMQVAESHYEVGIGKISALPLRVRLGIRGAARMYREIMNEVRERAYDNVRHRAYVSRSRKAGVLLYDGYGSRKRRLLAGSGVLPPGDTPQRTRL